MGSKETEELSGREAVEQVCGSHPPQCEKSRSHRRRCLPGACGMVNAKSVSAGGDGSSVRQARAAGRRSQHALGLYEHPCYGRLCVGAKQNRPSEKVCCVLRAKAPT
jgi:hypothetical protein